MEKFSRKEKVALSVFGIILLAIIVQMIWRLGNSDSLPREGILVEEVGMNLPGNLLKSREVQLTASSHNKKHEAVSSLLDSNRKSFWHVALNRLEEPAWVTVDFGEGNKKTVKTLMALPRHDLPHQFFRKAELFGSDDGTDWELVSEIVQGEPPRMATWRKWTFENEHPYRYYQLYITNGHEGGCFFSMAELALFE